MNPCEGCQHLFSYHGMSRCSILEKEKSERREVILSWLFSTTIESCPSYQKACSFCEGNREPEEKCACTEES